MVNNNQPTPDKWTPLINQVRERFERMVKQDSSQFEENDIKRVFEDDFFVKRFIIVRRKNVDSASEMLANTLRWIKREGFTNVPLNAFPAEVYLIGALFDYEKDLKGNSTVYLRVRYVFKIGFMIPHVIQWASKFFYELDLRNMSAFYAVIIDFSECGLQNAEYSFIYHAIYILRTYLPACISYILVVDLPRILKCGWHFVKRLVPADQRSLLKFISRKQITQFVSKENLPDFMGGTCSRPYNGKTMVPEGCPTAIEYGIQKGVPLVECLKVARIYEPIVREYGIYDLEEDEDLVKLVEKEINAKKQGKTESNLDFSKERRRETKLL